MSGFEDMISEYKDFLELKTFAESQHRVITDLSKKIQKLEEENKTLKSIADKVTPINVGTESHESLFGSSDPEIIARTQLAILKRLSMSGEEMTMDEAKRAQIFSDILIKATEKKNEPKQLEAMDTKTLLEALEGSNE